MIIKTTIKGKEVIGYWNGKTYKSKTDPEKNIRIYIDNIEYDIPKDEFQYEIQLSEKQKEKAKKLKDKFLEILQEENWKVSKKIVNFFREKDEEWYHRNEKYIKNLLSNIKLRPTIVEAVINGDPLKAFKIKRIDTDEETLKDVMQRMLTYTLYHEPLPSPNSRVKIYEDDKNYYLRFSSYDAVFIMNKNTKEIQVQYEFDILQKRKPKPIALLEY